MHVDESHVTGVSDVTPFSKQIFDNRLENKQVFSIYFHSVLWGTPLAQDRP